MSLSRGVGLGSLGLSNSLPNLGGSGTEDGSDPTTRFAPGANSAWDFINNYARFKDVYYGPLANTPGWSFTRASTGYAQTSAGALQSFASGELRRTDKGVLIEGSGTNLCLQSQTFDNASWTKNQSSVSANATTAPDGTSTADLLTEDSTAGAVHRATQSPTTTAAAHTASVYVKPNGRTWVYMRMTDNTSTPRRCYFNCSGSGSVGTAESGMTGSIAALANGWYRISAKIGTALAGANFLVFGLSSADNTETYNGDGASGAYLWGAQLEATAYASSYIPTTTASATRAADVLTVTGVTGLDYPLSLYAEFEIASTVSSWSGALLTVSDGTVAERAFLAGDGSATAKLNAQSRKASAVEGNVSSAATLSVGAVYKGAARFTTNDVNIALSGAAGTADTTATNPTAPTQINFGANVAGANPFYGYLRRLAIFSRALSDAELQAMTT